ncbi:MAG: GNAT family N-acetyltransferase [Bosea sp. (in: a-proteobacteria)]
MHGTHLNTLELVRACEERIVNAWPAIDTLFAKGCVIRMAAGYSGRANALSAMVPDTTLAPDFLDWVEAIYRQAGLPPRVRITPLLASSMPDFIAARGYVQDNEGMGMLADLVATGASADTGISISPTPANVWVDGICTLQTGNKQGANEALMDIVSRIRIPVAFMTLHHEGAPVAFGMSAVERGMAEIGAIIVDERLRGKGLARKLVVGLMDWAAQAGAARAYLQVEPTNTHAVSLYRSLGFEELYRYRTMRLEP